MPGFLRLNPASVCDFPTPVVDSPQGNCAIWGAGSRGERFGAHDSGLHDFRNLFQEPSMDSLRIPSTGEPNEELRSPCQPRGVALHE